MKAYLYTAISLLIPSGLYATDIHVSPSGFYSGTPCFTTVQNAINNAANGDHIFIHAGTYQENILVNKAVTLTGDGTGITFILPAISDIGDPANLGSQIGKSDIVLVKSSHVTIEDMTIDGSNPSISGNEATVNGVTIDARNGIVLDDRLPADQYDNLLLDHLAIKNIFERAVRISNPAVKSPGNIVQNCAIENVEGNYGSFGIFYYWSNGKILNNQLDHAIINANWSTNLDVSNNVCTNSITGISIANSENISITYNTVNSMIDGSYGVQMFQTQGVNQVSNNNIYNCSYGIIVQGSYNGQPLTVANNTIDGNYGASPILANTYGIFTTTEVTGYAPGQHLNVHITGNNIIQNVSTGLFIQATNDRRDDIGLPVLETYADSICTNTTRIDGAVFQSISNNYIKLDKDGLTSAIPNIDATTVSFDSYSKSQADGFAIEDKIYHKMDDLLLGKTLADGLVYFNDRQIYVTQTSTNNSIQAGIDNAPGDGWTVNVKTAPYYSEDLRIDKSVTLDHDGTTMAVNSVEMAGTNKVLSLNKNLSVIQKLTFGAGIIQTNSNKLQLQNDADCFSASDQSHVVGTIEKTGNSAFVFPLGNGTIYRPCSISAPASTTDAFTARYYGQSPRPTLTPSTINDAGAKPMVLVSDMEYWDIERTSGSSQVQVGINWANETTSGYKNSDNDLVVAYHNASGWENEHGILSTDAFVWVTTDPLDQFGYFALGSTSPQTTLPITFTSLQVTPNNNTAILKWRVAGEEEYGVKEYKVLRSTDGVHFTQIATINNSVSNAKNYTYIDASPATGRNYYKIAMVNNINHSTYSIVASCSFTSSSIQINCNNNSNIFIPYSAQESQSILTVTASNGSVVISQPFDRHSSKIDVKIPVSGIYIFTISDTKGNLLGSKKSFVSGN